MSKSDSSNFSVESEDSGSVLKMLIPINFKHKAGDGTGTRERKLTNICPSLQADEGGLSQKPFVVSSPTTSTSTPVRSTESGSVQESLPKATSEASPQTQYPTMTSSQLASLVKVFPLRENVKVFKTSQGELFSLKSVESYEIKDHATYSLRMLRDYFLTTQDGRLQLYSFHWMSLGMMRNGLSQTLSITYRKTGKGSLSSVLEEKVDEKYYLKRSALKKLMPEISPVIRAEHHNTDDVHFILRDGRDNRSCLRGERTPEIGVMGQSIRRLTPRECERLQGFPDDWTAGVSDTQRYKAMGNAVSVPVIEAIGKRIAEYIGAD